MNIQLTSEFKRTSTPASNFHNVDQNNI